MLNLTEHDIVRKTLLDFNLAEHYVEAIMTEIERRIQIADVTASVAEAIENHKLTDTMLSIVKDLPTEGPIGPTGPRESIPFTGVQYQTGPRPQPYNHDRSQL